MIFLLSSLFWVEAKPLYAEGGEGSQGDLELALDDTLQDLQEPGEDILHEGDGDMEKEISGKEGDQANLFERLMSKVRKKMLEKVQESPFHDMHPRKIENLILEKTEGTFAGDFLKNSPRLLYFIASFLKSKNAMTDLMGIFKREKDLKKYSYFVLGNIIFFLLLGWYYDRKSKGGLIKWLFRKIFFFLLSTGLCFLVFYMIFHREIKSTLYIAKDAITKSFPEQRS